MLAAGIKAPVPLEELETHLREEVELQMRSGVKAQQAFRTAVRQIGPAEVLKTEFLKAGAPIYKPWKQLFCTLAGIPHTQPATNMNTLDQNLEPRWATYLRTSAFIVPAVLFWAAVSLFVLPALKEVCLASGTYFPKPLVLALDVSDFVRDNFIVGTVGILTALLLLEWRSPRWLRYRRLLFGILAFLSNFMAFTLMTALLIYAVKAGANLSHPLR